MVIKLLASLCWIIIFKFLSKIRLSRIKHLNLFSRPVQFHFQHCVSVRCASALWMSFLWRRAVGEHAPRQMMRSVWVWAADGSSRCFREMKQFRFLSRRARAWWMACAFIFRTEPNCSPHCCTDTWDVCAQLSTWVGNYSLTTPATRPVSSRGKKALATENYAGAKICVRGILFTKLWISSGLYTATKIFLSEMVLTGPFLTLKCSK